MMRKHRVHQCPAGHRWVEPVQLSPSTQNLSGEKTAFCPVCYARAEISEPAQDCLPSEDGTYCLACGQEFDTVSSPAVVLSDEQVEETLVKVLAVFEEAQDREGYYHASAVAHGALLALLRGATVPTIQKLVGVLDRARKMTWERVEGKR